MFRLGFLLFGIVLLLLGALELSHARHFSFMPAWLDDLGLLIALIGVVYFSKRRSVQ
jgi:hypothetical protein